MEICNYCAIQKQRHLLNRGWWQLHFTTEFHTEKFRHSAYSLHSLVLCMSNLIPTYSVRREETKLLNWSVCSKSFSRQYHPVCHTKHRSVSGNQHHNHVHLDIICFFSNYKPTEKSPSTRVIFSCNSQKFPNDVTGTSQEFHVRQCRVHCCAGWIITKSSCCHACWHAEREPQHGGDSGK